MTPGLRSFGDYILLEQIGAGGMGQVFRAQIRDTERVVALKLAPIDAVLSDQRLERFRREGEITAALRHPHIVSVHDAGVINGRPFLAYQLVESTDTLADVLRDWPLRRRVEALRDVARALGHAHRHGVVHRDVKPENVLVTQEGRVLLADFGLASATGLERITQTQGLLGTPLYMPPELATEGSRASGPQSDVYSLGVILYEALAGAHPYAAAGVQALVDPKLRAAPPPHRRDPKIPMALSRACMQALECDPRDRQPNGDALAEDLEAWLAGGASISGPVRLMAVATAGLIAVGAAALIWLPGEVSTDRLAGATPKPASDPQPTESAPDEPSARAQTIARVRAWLAANPAKLTELTLRLLELRDADPAAARTSNEAALADEVLALLGERWDLATFPVLEALAASGCRPASWEQGFACMRRLSEAVLSGRIGDGPAEELAVGQALRALVRLDVELDMGFLKLSERYWQLPAGVDPWSRYLELRTEVGQPRWQSAASRVQLRELIQDTPELGPFTRSSGIYASYSFNERVPGAREDLLQALEWDPESPWVSGSLAGALAEAGELAEAGRIAAETVPRFRARYPTGPYPLAANSERVSVEIAFFVLIEAKLFDEARVALAFTEERHPNSTQLQEHRSRLAVAEAEDAWR